jgi:hypothetical protein
MTKIITGRIAGKNHYSELDAICATNSLVTGMTRSGKSYKLRTMAEALHSAIPTWIIDPEDEFYSLREKFPFLLFGEGGEAPLAVGSARVMARYLLKWGVSAVLSMAALKEEQQHEWVYNFLDELMQQPRADWKRVCIILDEAHLWAPNGGHGKSEALMASRNLARRGLKRGLVPIWATQRLASLSVAVSSSAENMMVGRTTRSADQEQAAKLLGVGTEEKAALAAKLRRCKRGDFFAVGPAYGEDIVTLQTLTAKTTHFSGKIGMEPDRPPTPEGLLYLLPEIEAMQTEARQTSSEDGTPIPSPVSVTSSNEDTYNLRCELEVERGEKKQIAGKLDTVSGGLGDIRTATVKLEERLMLLSVETAATFEELRTAAQQIADHAVNVMVESDQGVKSLEALGGPVPDSSLIPVTFTLTKREEVILKSMREAELVGMSEVSRKVCAQFCGYSVSGAFVTELGKLRQRGFISIPKADHISLTAKGKVMVPAATKPPTQEEMMERLHKMLGDQVFDVANLLARRRGMWLPVSGVCKEAKYGVNSKAFKKSLDRLKAWEVVEYRAADKHVRIAPHLLIKEQAGV